MEEKNIKINLSEVWAIVKSKKKTYYKIWLVTFVLSCIWIFPQPRYYTAEVSLAPETAHEGAGGLAGIASSFGLNLGGAGVDALYPALYPELITSNEFIVGLLPIPITTHPKDKSEQSITTDYYTYIRDYQKENYLLYPFILAKKGIKKFFGKEKNTDIKATDVSYFCPSESDTELLESISDLISCSFDRQTEVVTITVTDQDAFVCATMADSVRQHIQDFIIKYRTKKARIDVEHYETLVDSAKKNYLKAVERYAKFSDSHLNTVLQASTSQRDILEGEMQLRYSTYQTLATQLEVTKTKLQEQTPAFTVLKPSVVPVKPSGPKRMRFVFGMMFFVSFIATAWFTRRELKKLIV